MSKKAYSYEVTKIELVDDSSDGVQKDSSRPLNPVNNSIPVANILKGVEKSYAMDKLLLMLKYEQCYSPIDKKRMEIIEGTQSKSAVGLDGKPVPSSMTSITGAKYLNG